MEDRSEGCSKGSAHVVDPIEAMGHLFVGKVQESRPQPIGVRGDLGCLFDFLDVFRVF